MENTILVVESNSLTALTVNSIKRNMPGWNYEVVQEGQGLIDTALRHCSDVTLVVKSGIILDLKEGDLPPISTLEKYALCAARDCVWADHSGHRHVYGLIGQGTGANDRMDLSIFIINPALWDAVPEFDEGALKDKKVLRMPRCMNHKEDLLIAESLSAKHVLEYGMLASRASVFNYTNVFLSGEANGNQMLAYPLENALSLMEGLPVDAEITVRKVAEKTEKQVAAMRTGLSKVLPIGA